jgi:hypothetical protein
MRRAAALSIMAVALAVTSTLAPPAQAHLCSNAVDFEVNTPGAVAFGVPAEDFPVTEVEVTIPGRFELTGVDGPPGWTSNRTGRQLRLVGGPIEPLTCAFFTLRGVVAKPAKLAFPFVIRGEDGRSSEYKGTKLGDPLGAQLVFAGVTPEASDYLQVGGEGGHGGGSTLQPVFLAAAGGLAVGGALALLARRRAAQS